MIIFGGIETNVRPENSLYVLSLNYFNWSTPKLSGKIPPSRAFHKSVVIGKYMVVTFGKYKSIENFYYMLSLNLLV